MADQATIDDLGNATATLLGIPGDFTTIGYKARDEIRRAAMELHPDDVSDYLVTALTNIVAEAVTRVENDIR